MKIRDGFEAAGQLNDIVQTAYALGLWNMSHKECRPSRSIEEMYKSIVDARKVVDWLEEELGLTEHQKIILREKFLMIEEQPVK